MCAVAACGDFLGHAHLPHEGTWQHTMTIGSHCAPEKIQMQGASKGLRHTTECNSAMDIHVWTQPCIMQHLLLTDNLVPLPAPVKVVVLRLKSPVGGFAKRAEGALPGYCGRIGRSLHRALLWSALHDTCLAQMSCHLSSKHLLSLWLSSALLPDHRVFFLFPIFSPFLEEQVSRRHPGTLVRSRCADCNEDLCKDTPTHARAYLSCARSSVEALDVCGIVGTVHLVIAPPQKRNQAAMFSCFCLPTLAHVMWLVVSFVAGCHANSISKGGPVARLSGKMRHLHLQMCFKNWTGNLSA